jgi:hypothetical protein
MSPTCAHCLRCGSACRRRKRAAFSSAMLCVSRSNVPLYYRCWLRQSVGCSCSERRYPRCYSFTDNSLFVVTNVLLRTVCFFYTLPWTWIYPLAGCAWPAKLRGPVVGPRCAGVAKCFVNNLTTDFLLQVLSRLSSRIKSAPRHSCFSRGSVHYD